MKNCLYFLLFLAWSCSQENNPPALFERVTNSGIQFNNKVVDGELENSFYFRNFYNGGGVAIGDINNDSLPDVMLTFNLGETNFTSIRATFNLKTSQLRQA